MTVHYNEMESEFWRNQIMIGYLTKGPRLTPKWPSPFQQDDITMNSTTNTTLQHHFSIMQTCCINIRKTGLFDIRNQILLIFVVSFCFSKSFSEKESRDTPQCNSEIICKANMKSITAASTICNIIVNENSLFGWTRITFHSR